MLRKFPFFCPRFPCEPSCNESKLADKYRDLYKAWCLA